MDFSYVTMRILKSGGLLPLFAAAFAGCGSILTFHRVTPAAIPAPFSPNRGLTVTPAFFETLIGFLRSQNREIISLDEMLERLRSPVSDRRFVCLTLDDGYRDNFDYVLPICRKAHAPFTVFVTSGFHDGRYSAWWLGLEKLLATRSELHFEWQGTSYAFVLGTPEQKQAAFAAVAKLFSPLAGDQRNVLGKIVCAGTEIDFRAHTTELVMTLEMVAELDQSDVGHIGGHTVSHPRLACLPAELARREIKMGCEELERIVGRKIRHFAYPHGQRADAGPRDFEICRDLGLQTAATTRNANLTKDHRDFACCLPRLNISGSRQSLAAVEAQLSGAPSALLHKFRRVVTA